MNYNIEVDTNTIYGFSKAIEEHGNKYINVLDKLMSETEKVNECFDTETGKVLKERMIELIRASKEMINNKYISYSKTIKKLGDIYEETNEEIRKSVE